MSSETSSTISSEMIIKTKEDWNEVLLLGAEVLYETKYCKIFRMPDGRIWRCLPKYRRAWPFDTWLYMKIFS
jgi:hypothetical protein